MIKKIHFLELEVEKTILICFFWEKIDFQKNLFFGCIKKFDFFFQKYVLQAFEKILFL
jgi:hypothetical protein